MPEVIAVQKIGGSALSVELRFHGCSDGRLTGAWQAREPDQAAALAQQA
jgi:hypothetical protein